MGLIQAAASVLRKASAGWEASDATVCSDGSGEEFCIHILGNMARTEAVVNTIRDCQLLPVLRLVLDNNSSEILKMQLVLLIAHVYCVDERNEQASELLQKSDISQTLVSTLDAAMQKRTMGDVMFSQEELLHGLQSVTRSEVLARRATKAGTAALLVEIINTNQAHVPLSANQDQQQGSPGGKATTAAALPEAGSPVDLVTKACRTLLNMASIVELRPQLIQQGVPEAVTSLQHAADSRVADAAQSILLQLGLHANQSAAESLMGGEHGDQTTQSYQVFLSHKRSDAKDFARALYNLLVLRGISTFLDFEYREELANLANVVAKCANLIFILSDDVFASHWCLLELESAIKNNVNIILVTKEGSRWPDRQGNKVAEFPPDHLIATLPEAVRKVLTRKSIKHSDEYYQSFVEQLLKRVVKAPAAPAATAMPAAAAATCSDGQAALTTPGARQVHIGAAHAAHPALNHAPSPALAQAPTSSGTLLPVTTMGTTGVAQLPDAYVASPASWAVSTRPVHMPPWDQSGMQGPVVPWAMHQQELQQLRNDMARMTHEAAMERQMLRMEHQQAVAALQAQVAALTARMDMMAASTMQSQLLSSMGQWTQARLPPVAPPAGAVPMRQWGGSAPVPEGDEWQKEAARQEEGAARSARGEAAQQAVLPPVRSNQRGGFLAAQAGRDVARGAGVQALGTAAVMRGQRMCP